MEQKNQKKVAFFKIIALEPESANPDILEQDTSHWQSICFQATLTFNVALEGSIFQSRFAQTH